jgi:glucose uptake protein GlcU
MESSTSMTSSSNQITPFPLLCQCSVEVGEDSNPTKHARQEKMAVFDARQWYRSRPVILGFLSSILFQTTAVLVVQTDEQNERKRQIAEVLMTTPLRYATIFYHAWLAVFLPVLFCSGLTRSRKPLL